MPAMLLNLAQESVLAPFVVLFSLRAAAGAAAVEAFVTGAGADHDSAAVPAGRSVGLRVECVLLV